MLEALNLPKDWQGNLWHYRFQDWRHTYHHHVELEFNLITGGTGIYLLDNEKYQVHRGDLIWLYPTQSHVLVQETADFAMWIGVVRPQALDVLATDANHAALRQDRASTAVCRRLPLKQMQQLCTLLEAVVTTKERAAYFNSGLGYALLTAWQFFENASAIPIEDVHPAVDKAAHILQRDNDAITLVQLARQTGLSPSRLSRLFKQQTGVTIVDFRNRQRLAKFLSLYGNGQRHTMLNAALAAGFGSYPQFHREFKKNLGRSPRATVWQ